MQGANWIEVDFPTGTKIRRVRSVFDELKRAVFSCRRVSFSYFAGEGGGTVRTVEPVKLIFKSKDWYLYGFCLLRNDYRFFKLTRIKDLTLLPETFLRRKADVPELKPTIQQERLSR